MGTVDVNGRPLAIRELACRHLVEEPRGRFACAVYERRFELAPWCLPIPEALAEDVLAPDCPYREGVWSPAAPRPLHSRLVRSLAPQLRAIFADDGWPEWVDEAALPAWLRGDE